MSKKKAKLQPCQCGAQHIIDEEQKMVKLFGLFLIRRHRIVSRCARCNRVRTRFYVI